MATRLTNDMRNAVKGKLLRRSFVPEGERLLLDFSALAHRVYEEIFKEVLPAMEALPAGWLERKSDFKVSLGYKTAQLSFIFGLGNSPTSTLSVLHLDPTHVKPTSRAFLHKNKFQDRLHSFIEDHPLTQEFNQHVKKRDDLESRVSKASSQIGALLSSLTTVEKAMKVWPEAEDFLKPLLRPRGPGGQVSHLPMIQMNQLNDLLDLPPTNPEK